MPIRAIDHVQLAMPRGEEAAARGFYAGVLGLEEVAKPPELARRGGAWFRSGAVQVHLGVDAEFRPAVKAHPAFVVDELTAIVARARAAGVKMNSDEPLPGYERVFLFDPFGNRIELMQAKG
jgi:catechol 2,3-dioxygenase-like lactoylglutathione lyase family enzyme